MRLRDQADQPRRRGGDHERLRAHVLAVRLTSPGTLDADAADELAEQPLRMLGLTPEPAREVAQRPPPPLPDHQAFHFG
jgi:hypothetical protein